ncbi:MAG: 3-phosphoshikimate 1-carboxyvinyltransferase [Melioribacter sp.]|uniref:3-phosphoshikimate 1-carboxyvinyltransferase n=1 Tax=Rosettibacter primus TaxID=3111523 RepID=UPI00247B39D9|nr:3-phosphoshikimate 1-carboxyvinyltransferase [Melioribacter sp.]
MKFYYTENLNGELSLPGDKSISHRAVMFASMAEGESIIKNCSNAEDVKSTISCFRKLGVEIQEKENLLIIKGKGFKNFSRPEEKLYAGNSGTTARLMSGILCAQNFESIITGDESLSKRPMKRIVEPLNMMGANITASDTGTLPLIIKPSKNLHTIKYKLKVASAQVKSALILAALHLEDESIIIEQIPSRNHTEKLLGLKTENTEEGTLIYVSKKNYPKNFEITVPSDISTASFFIVLGLLSKNSNILIKNVSLNETRTGILEILNSMGAKITIEDEIIQNGEKRGNIRVKSSELRNTEIPEEIIPNIIDEIPILSVAGVFAEGKFRVTNAKELRVKESDRIKALCENYKRAGLKVVEYEDGFEVDGKIVEGNLTFESYGDHRIAMAYAVMSMLLKNGGQINNFDCVSISNPDFLAQLQCLGYNSKI